MQTDFVRTTPTGMGAKPFARLAALFDRWPLHLQFAIVGSTISLLGMLIIGSLVSDSIETSVVRNSAISSAVYMESFIAPMSQELASETELSPETIQRMRDLLDSAPLSDRIVSAKIWRKGGLIAFSSDPDLIGRTFPPGEKLKAAWAGNLSASFDDLDDAENLRERQSGLALLEVYNPIHSIVSGEIIAVAEFYMDASELRTDLRRAHARAWAAVGIVTLCTFAALFGVVLAGSRTIAAQNRALAARLDEVARISGQNAALRERVQAASRRVAETNERHMRRISAELHDGPAQALALASLRLDAVTRRSGLDKDDAEVRDLRITLDEALSDVRDLCKGLTLPELEGRSVGETLELAISAHERRTGVSVQRDFDQTGALSIEAPHPILICIYRVVQEGLMNAYRHAAGSEVRVSANCDGALLEVSVADRGPGLDPDSGTGQGLGLAGLRERVESIGGEFSITCEHDKGTRLSVRLAREMSW